LVGKTLGHYLHAGALAALLLVGTASAGQEQGDWRIATQGSPGEPTYEVILTLRGNRTFMSASNLGAGDAAAGRGITARSLPTIPILSLGCRGGATLLHIDSGLTHARPRPVVDGAFFRYDGGAEVIQVLQRDHATFSGAQTELVLHIGAQGRWNLLVPEDDVRNVISKMLAHERLDIILNAHGFPLRSVRYDVGGVRRGSGLDRGPVRVEVGHLDPPSRRRQLRPRHEPGDADQRRPQLVRGVEGAGADGRLVMIGRPLLFDGFFVLGVVSSY